MLGMLDEAIADLRAAAGLRRFDLNFVAAVEPFEYREPLLPTPTPREAIEQTLLRRQPDAVVGRAHVAPDDGRCGTSSATARRSTARWAWTTRVAVNR